MKISKLFHWLYAILMFLPIVNVFAYTLRYGFNYGHEIPVVSENVQKTVNFNQLVQSGNFDDLTKWSFDPNLVSVDKINDELFLLTSVGTDYPRIEQGINFNYIKGHKYYYTFNAFSDNLNHILSSTCEGWFSQSVTTTNTKYQYIINCSGSFSQISYTFGFYEAGSFYVSNFMCVDLTQMFGVGNEPTMQEFVFWFPDSYYDYTLSEYVVIPNYNSVSVSDDVTNHFWLPSFGQVGYTINNVIGYLLLNVFGLAVSEGIGYIVCGLFTYWLIISLAWLVFDLLMYVPQLVHRWLDKASIS